MNPVLLNVILFNVGWWTIVLGTKWELYFAGPIVVTLLIAGYLWWRPSMKRSAMMVGGITAVGLAVDWLLIVTGVWRPAKGIFVSDLLPPVWLFFFWINFSQVLNVSLGWLREKTALAAVLGGIGGSTSYFAGDRFGILNFTENIWISLAIMTAVWAVLTPVLLRLAYKLERPPEQ